ncbi:MAG: DUF4037 domain-containing protein [Chloroflexota bacterium]|nr:MAG: DUF4037 domain-containing protein [Chloroflexota bacterium]
MDVERFIPGLDLAERFYNEVVRPVLDARFPGLVHSAALLGFGSEVLGYDTPQSMDHEWGVRGQIFLSEGDHEEFATAINVLLARESPREFLGLPVDLVQRDGVGNFIMTQSNKGPVRHGVRVVTVGSFCRGRLGFDPRPAMRFEDWLVVPQQLLLGVTAGRVFHDGLAQLAPLRDALRYYPDEVWLALLAAQWRRIDQEEPFMARCGDVGDDVGSRLVAARQAREMMRLCFLMERRYWPYTKWFGTAFARLACAERIGPLLATALRGETWPERERALNAAGVAIAEMHNALGLTPPIEAAASRFHERSYRVIHAGRFVEALLERIADPILRDVAMTGCIDQFADSTDILSYPERISRLRGFFPSVAPPT